jgi:hypothetical protein
MRRTQRLTALLVPFVLIAGNLLTATAAQAGLVKSPRVHAAVMTNSITLKVASSRDSIATHGPKAGAAITTYKWLLNLDNTGNPGQSDLPNSDSTACHPSTDPAYPANCAWPSIHTASSSPVLSQGNESDWNLTKALPNGTAVNGVIQGLPSQCDVLGNPLSAALVTAGMAGQPCKFLVSVLANGYELGGAHFSNPMAAPGLVTASLNPYPLPLGNIRIIAYQDTAPTDATYEAGAEAVIPGFVAQVNDMNGVVTVDYYGNPLCTTYFTYQNTAPRGRFFTTNASLVGKTVVNADGIPTVKTLGGRCVTGADGEVTIPNMTPGHYMVSLIAPDNSSIKWIQTTTLEGNHDFDVWVMANDTGLDTELVVGGEPVPFVEFGYVNGYLALPATPAGQTAPTGEIKGKIMTGLPYVPGIGGLPGVGNTGGTAGLKLGKPVPEGWLALNDLQNNDQLVWSGPAFYDPGNPTDPRTGTFDITGVPAGNYNLAVWDRPQNYLIDGFNVTVGNPGAAIAPGGVGTNNGAPGSQLVDVGVVPLIGWFTDITGKICVDKNNNGRCDPGEPGVPDFALQNLNRTNNMYEQGQNAANTNDAGNYEFIGAYPLGQFTVEQAFNPRYKTTGITYQACNDPQEHTIQTGAVDISFLPVFGLCGRIDWAVTPYDSQNQENGGIVATVFYDPIRQKFNARQAQAFPYQTGIPGIPMHLLNPVPAAAGQLSDPLSGYALDPLTGAYLTTPFPANTGGVDYTTENYGKPTGCVPRAADGTVLNNNPASPYFQDVQKVFLNSSGQVDTTAQATATCIEAPLSGVTMGLGTPDVANYSGQTVDGNYALAPPNPGDWIVQMEIPKDQVLADGRNLYKVTTENDVNLFQTPSEFVPQGADNQAVAWPPNPTPSSPQMTAGDYQENPHTSANGPDPLCAGSQFVANVTDPNVYANGGSPLQGQTRHMCDLKLIHTEAGQSVAPNFHLYTDVPIPTKFSGYITDDASISTNPRASFYGEVAGVANLPIGVYDWTGRLVHEMNSDYNGVWEAIMPSSTVMCPTPSSFCPNVYRFVGNDPGQPGAANANHDPNYRVISAMFNSWPGMFMPADVAPTRNVTQILGPAGQFKTNVVCAAQPTDPQIFTVDQPYTNTTSRVVTIKGLGFGDVRGSGNLSLVGQNGSVNNLAVSTWTNKQITATLNTSVPTNIVGGSYSLQVTTGTGAKTVNGVGFAVLKGSYNPTLITVGPGKQIDPTIPYDPRTNAANLNKGGIHAVQKALDLAASRSSGGALVVVYPNAPSSFTPVSAYYENVVIHSPLKLQGVGPGGVYTDGTAEVPGSVLDGQFFNSTTAGSQVGAAEPTLQDWYTLVTGLTWGGNQTISDAEVVYVLARNGQWNNAAQRFSLGLDGFSIQNGNQLDFPGNIQQLGGAKTSAFPPDVVTQGGAVYLNGYADHFQLSNNVVKGNNGAYGAIRVGSPQQGTNLNTPNRDVQLTHNRIIVSGGTNLAGAVGMFTGSTNYRIDNNIFCGNQTVEYGGAISHYGRSDNGRIDHNLIYLNQSVDEGAGIQVSGELPATPTGLSKGSGALTIDHNYIAANMSNDDGAGIRLLMAGKFAISIHNNMITNNVSLHEGAGIALDDSTNVTIANNTIAKNITTATAPTSSGQPAPAGISSVKNSSQLQATLAAGASVFSNPTLNNNILWDNRAGSWTPAGIAGIGMPGDTTALNRWDVGTADGTGFLAPHKSVMNTPAGTSTQGWTNDGSNTVSLTPTTVADDNAIGFVAPFDLQLSLAAQRTYFRFRPSAIVSVSLPTNAIGDYHLADGSPATGPGSPARLINTPQNTTTTGTQVRTDIDDQLRPGNAALASTPTDAGADQHTSPGPVQNLALRAALPQGAATQLGNVVTAAGPAGAVTNSRPLATTGQRFLDLVQQPFGLPAPLGITFESLLVLMLLGAVLKTVDMYRRRRREAVPLRLERADTEKEVQL